MKIIISGNPGVGKHTISNEISQLIHDVYILDINKVVLSQHLLVKQGDEFEVDLSRTCNSINSMISQTNNSNIVIIGHLAPYVVNPLLIDLAVILRRSPYELKKVYELRGYSKNKINDNLVSEILGIISFDFAERFNKKNIAELEISESILPSFTAQQIIDMCYDKKLRKFGDIDWFPIVSLDPQMLKILTMEVENL